MNKVIVSIGFDDARSHHIRFLEESAKLGELTVLLWSDDDIRSITGADPKFPCAERAYFLDALRYVASIIRSRGGLDPDALPRLGDFKPDVWAVDQALDSPARRAFCKAAGIEHVVIDTATLDSFPPPELDVKPPTPGRRKVIVTGCYDWFHTGHVRFFEEMSELGDVYAVVGHDANIALLKGPGRPLYKQDERRYIVGSLKSVHQAFISTGEGYLDAIPEIARIQPDIYAVNEDGHKEEKRAHCEKLGIEYVVRKRTPKEGLQARSSTDLRGF